MDTLITDISELVRIRDQGRPRRNREQSELDIVKNCCVGIKEGRIAYIGKKKPRAKRVIDAEGRVVTPGLVDAHTHLLFAGSRANEFEMRAQGKSYMEILKNGGGIYSTVKQTNKATEDELVKLGIKRLGLMRDYGTTTVEAKSGYSLTLEGEIKMLRVVQKLSRMKIVNIVPTLLAAHAVPLNMKREDYIRLIADKIIPICATEKLAKFCDVFCDQDAFTLPETRFILEMARGWGLGGKVHAEEFTHTGACRLRVASADHLLNANGSDIKAMSAMGTVAVLLPGTSFFLGARYAPARDLIKAGVPVALGTDFNPGSSMTLNMQLIMTIACTQLKMTPAEAIVAATLNSAYAIGMNSLVGSIDLGKLADLVIWNCSTWKEIPYFYGINQTYRVLKSNKV